MVSSTSSRSPLYDICKTLLQNLPFPIPARRRLYNSKLRYRFNQRALVFPFLKKNVTMHIYSGKRHIGKKNNTSKTKKERKILSVDQELLGEDFKRRKR